MVRGYSFRPRAWIVVLALAGCAAGVALGNWQTRRAEQKRVLAERVEASLEMPPISLTAAPIEEHDAAQKHVIATGVFAAERTVLLDNRNRGGRPGYEVITPLRLSPSMAVLVQRGWLARERVSQMRTPGGVQHIDGIGIEHLPRALAAPGADEGRVRQNLDIAAYARELGVALQPVVIQQRNDNGDGLSRDWPRPDFGRDTNRAYALQWYSLAALAAVLGIVFSFRRVEQA